MAKKNKLTLQNKCQLVHEHAQEMIDHYYNKNMTEEEVLYSMAKWAKEMQLKEYWFAIDTELQRLHECSSWFWIIRRLRNYPEYWT